MNMETSTMQRLKSKAGRLIEGHLLQTGRVLEVRAWEPGTLIEVDLHLPFADMSSWTTVPYIKCRVAELVFRDYTPSGWDAETSTCTLFIETGHDGPGSRWACSLKKGTEISYLKIRGTDQCPSATSAIVALGDESSLGHLLALQQLTLPSGRFSGAVLMADENHRQLLPQYFRTPLQAIAPQNSYRHHTLMEWILAQSYSFKDTLFCLSGNNLLVSQLRKQLLSLGYSRNQVLAQGFWS
jgi:NADPH-dependent ferric siderophore reductase